MIDHIYSPRGGGGGGGGGGGAVGGISKGMFLPRTCGVRSDTLPCRVGFLHEVIRQTVGKTPMGGRRQREVCWMLKAVARSPSYKVLKVKSPKLHSFIERLNTIPGDSRSFFEGTGDVLGHFLKIPGSSAGNPTGQIKPSQILDKSFR